MTCMIECPYKKGLMCEATPQLREESRCIGCPAYSSSFTVLESSRMAGTHENVCECVCACVPAGEGTRIRRRGSAGEMTAFDVRLAIEWPSNLDVDGDRVGEPQTRQTCPSNAL